MAIADLLAVVPAPLEPVHAGPGEHWPTLQQSLGIALPCDYRDFGLRYGSGYFDDPGRLLMYVWNPFSPDYVQAVERCCDELREDRYDLPKEPNIPYGIFPHQPGWLPWGNDIDGSLLCWLTEGEPDDWPVILLSPERTSFQQVYMPMTTFLARAFTRQIQTILWEKGDIAISFQYQLAMSPLPPVPRGAVAATGSGVRTLSGWTPTNGFVDSRRATDEVTKVSQEMGYTHPPHALFDRGVQGRFYASHAEKQMAVTRPGELIAVSKDMCESTGRGDCITWFRRFAQYRQQTQVVVDPHTIRVFWRDGTVTEIPR